jgi:hypothetical protein
MRKELQLVQKMKISQLFVVPPENEELLFVIRLVEDWASPLVSPASCSLSASGIGKSSVMVESPSPDPMLISYPPQSDSSSDSSTLSGWVGTSRR